MDNLLPAVAEAMADTFLSDSERKVVEVAGIVYEALAEWFDTRVIREADGTRLDCRLCPQLLDRTI